MMHSKVRSSKIVLEDVLRNRETYYAAYGEGSIDRNSDGYYEIVLVKFPHDKFGWMINIDLKRKVAWSIAAKRMGVGGVEPMRWLDMDRPGDYWNTQLVATSLDEEKMWLEELGIVMIDYVQPNVAVGDVVELVGSGRIMAVRKVERVNTPATPHGYTYIASCSRFCCYDCSVYEHDLAWLYGYGEKKYLQGDENPSLELFKVDDRFFHGESYNHKGLKVVGNYEISDSDNSKS